MYRIINKKEVLLQELLFLRKTADRYRQKVLSKEPSIVNVFGEYEKLYSKMAPSAEMAGVLQQISDYSKNIREKKSNIFYRILPLSRKIPKIEEP